MHLFLQSAVPIYEFHISFIIFHGFVSQVEGKDSELRELKSKLSSLQDQHEQAQSKVRAHFRLFSFVSTPCCYGGVWSSDRDRGITLTSDMKIHEKVPGLSGNLEIFLIPHFINFRENGYKLKARNDFWDR